GRDSRGGLWRRSDGRPRRGGPALRRSGRAAGPARRLHGTRGEPHDAARGPARSDAGPPAAGTAGGAGDVGTRRGGDRTCYPRFGPGKGRDRRENEWRGLRAADPEGEHAHFVAVSVWGSPFYFSRAPG